VGYGKALMSLVSVAAPTPDDLPEGVRASHLKRTLIYANELSGSTASRRKGTVDLEQLLRTAYTSDWATTSVLMRLDGNAWPEAVKSWLDRIGVGDDRLQWMKAPQGDGSESLESRVKSLITERNDLAHGVRPVALQSAASMNDWLAAVMEFSRRTYACVQVAYAEGFPAMLASPLGELDPGAPALGASTVAIAELKARIDVGGHVLARSADGKVVCAQVLSMQSDGLALEQALPGQQRVAVTLNRAVAGIEFFPVA
jgi:hypothetical protein